MQQSARMIVLRAAFVAAVLKVHAALLLLCNAVADFCEVGQRGYDCLSLQCVFICLEFPAWRCKCPCMLSNAKMPDLSIGKMTHVTGGT